MRSADIIVEPSGKAVVLVTVGLAVVTRLEFANRGEAELYLRKAGWKEVSADRWSEVGVPYFFPVMVPPPMGTLSSSVGRAGKLGDLDVLAFAFQCAYESDRWAFCYRHRVPAGYFCLKYPSWSDCDPVLGLFCPDGVKAGGIGIWPSAELAIDMGVRMLDKWRATYGDDFLAAAVACYVRREELRAGSAAGLQLEIP